VFNDIRFRHNDHFRFNLLGRRRSGLKVRTVIQWIGDGTVDSEYRRRGDPSALVREHVGWALAQAAQRH
ncbi:MAG: hypothetical protein ACXWCW_31950, partial [Burkholderiales bacterium]